VWSETKTRRTGTFIALLITMKNRSMAFLLDMNPSSWDTRNDFHFRLCRALMARGWSVAICPACNAPEEISSRYRDAGIEMHPISFARGSYRYFLELRRLTKKMPLDLIHIWYFPYFSMVPWLARLNGIRNVVFSDVNSGEWRPKPWTSSLVRLRAKIACAPVVRMIAISRFISQRLELLGFARKRIEIIPGGVDVRRFSPDPGARKKIRSDFGVEPHEFVVSTACVLVPFKGVDVLLDACALLKKRQAPVRLFVAGDGPLRSELEAYARDLGIDDRTHWLGHVAEPEAVFRASDVFALSSVGEAFGLVLAEAMACEMPVVASRSGGIVDIVEDGVTGLLATPSDPASFADALELLWKSPALRNQLGIAGARWVRTCFDVEAVVERTADLYEAILREE